MHQALPFFADFARVCTTTLFLVATAAFVSIPYVLEGHPGEPVVAVAQHLS